MRQLEGGWLSNTAVERSKQRIQRLPFIEKVEVETTPVPGAPDLVDVDFEIEEGLPGAVRRRHRLLRVAVVHPERQLRRTRTSWAPASASRWSSTPAATPRRTASRTPIRTRRSTTCSARSRSAIATSRSSPRRRRTSTPRRSAPASTTTIRSPSTSTSASASSAQRSRAGHQRRRQRRRRRSTGCATTAIRASAAVRSRSTTTCDDPFEFDVVQQQVRHATS